MSILLHSTVSSLSFGQKLWGRTQNKRKSVTVTVMPRAMTCKPLKVRASSNATLLAACGIATWMSRSHAYWFSVLPLHGFSSKRGCLQCTIITLTSTASQQFLQGKHHWPAQKKLWKDFFNLQIWTSIHWYNWYSDGAVILQYWNSAYWTRGAYLQKGVLIGERALNRIINGNLL